MNFTLCAKQYNDWKIKTSKNFYDAIKGSLDQLDLVINFAKDKNLILPFRWSLDIDNIQYLTLIDLKNMQINIYSKNMYFEKLLADSNSDIASFVRELEITPLSNTPSFVSFTSFKYQLPDFNEERFNFLADSTLSIAKQLQDETSKYKDSIFEKMSNFALDLTAQYSLIRIHVLKFLAILPSLDHDNGDEIKKVFIETLRRLKSDSHSFKNKNDNENKPLPFHYIIAVDTVGFISKLVPAKLLAFVIRHCVSLLAQRFIAGTNIKDAKMALKGLKESGRDYTIDQLGELVVSNQEADIYMNKVIEIIEGLSTDEPHFNKASVNEEHVSIKVSALSNDFRSYAFDHVYNEVSVRLIKILLKAKEANVFINIDAEHFHYRDIVLKVFSKVLRTEPKLMDFKYCGIVLQAYLKDSFDHLADILKLAKDTNIHMPVRLVKGAYWDAETVETKAHNLESFQFLNKEETDLNFRQMCYAILENGAYLKLAVASHNILDHSFAEALKNNHFKDAPIIEHQCLHMTYEALSNGLKQMGYPTRNYIPVGDLLVGMAYLVRRIMENSSQVGILTIMRSHKGDLNYNNLADKVVHKIENKTYVYSNSLYKTEKTFKNIYPLEIYKEKKFKSMLESIQNIKGMDLIDLEHDTSDTFSKKLNILSIETNWSSDSAKRADVLLNLAYQLLIKRNYFAALIMKEAKKTVEEALADVDEAIDFISFYTKESLVIESEVRYQAKGIFGVIAPWNFPLAIPVGMSVSALATGNKVLLKPSEKTLHIVKAFYDLALDSGVSEKDFQIVYGDSKIGEAITSDSRIDGVVFTGSKNVGVKIYKQFKTRDTIKVPTVITEMGGKNAVIVTNNAELDETVSNLMYSSFAHAGQKCSASSRIIIDNNIKESFLKRFVEASKDIRIGNQFDLSTYINPLIGFDERELTITRAEQACEEAISHNGKVHLDRSKEESSESIVGPVIIELPLKRAILRDSHAQKEFFAPIVHVIGYDTIDEAISLFNSTEYALTGGIFSQSTDDYEYLMSKLEAGNLYINRSNTGARVAIEPFGGYKMSGTGPKAGSKEYLYSFIDFEKNEPHDLTKSFISYLKEMSFTYLNRQIPGQISYDDRLRPLGRGVFIVDVPLSLPDKIEIAMSIIAKNEVTIYQLNPDCIQFRDQEFFLKFAGKKVNVIEIFYKVDYEKFDFLVGMGHTLNIHTKDFIESSQNELKKVFNYSDYKDDFHLYLYKYTHAKSYAINIMRHGAALGIQEDL